MLPRYSQLPTQDNALIHDIDPGANRGREHDSFKFWARKASESLETILQLSLILSVIINMSTLAARAHGRDILFVPLQNLRVSSQYIGLEGVLFSSKHSSRLRRTNHPEALFQVAARRNKTQLGPTARIANNVVVSYEVRLFHSAGGWDFLKPFLWMDKTSTIAQFRAGDYGLTECFLTIVFPGSEVVEGTSKVYKSDNGNHLAELWLLSIDEQLRAPLLHGQTAERRTMSGRFNASAGNKGQVGSSFPCVSGAWFTFELAASSESFGHVEFRQDYALPLLGTSCSFQTN